MMMIIFYFINIPVDAGVNFNTYASILGIIIFHNPFVFGLYLLIALVCIVKGFEKSNNNARNKIHKV